MGIGGRRERYDKGDMQIEVEWFQRDGNSAGTRTLVGRCLCSPTSVRVPRAKVSGGDERRIFKPWAKDATARDAGPQEGVEYTFNSTELRAIRLEMRPLPPVGVALDVVRRGPARAAAQAAAQALRAAIPHISRRVQQQHADPPEQLWEISAGSERQVLDKCCR